jgi:hypothetical protein
MPLVIGGLAGVLLIIVVVVIIIVAGRGDPDEIAQNPPPARPPTPLPRPVVEIPREGEDPPRPDPPPQPDPVTPPVEEPVDPPTLPVEPIVVDPPPVEPQTPKEKSPLPDESSVSTARLRLEPTFAGESARQLIDRATAREDYDVETFAILCLAKDAATGNGDVRTAIDTIDELDTRFEIDALDMKAQLLPEVQANAKEEDDFRELARTALSLGEEAKQAGRSELARSCATVALGAARKCGDSDLVRQATLAIVQLSES